MKTLGRLLLLAAVLHGGALTAQGGRPLQVRPAQALNFGELVTGVPREVLPSDALNAGEFDIRGRRNAEVFVELALPAALVGPGGATVPLVFGAGSAGFSATGNSGAQVFFDPFVPQVFTLSSNGRVSVFLGGTATAPPQSPPGAYTSPVTMTVAYVSN